MAGKQVSINALSTDWFTDPLCVTARQVTPGTLEEESLSDNSLN